jgi:hypothetical protein
MFDGGFSQQLGSEQNPYTKLPCVKNAEVQSNVVNGGLISMS